LYCIAAQSKASQMMMLSLTMSIRTTVAMMMMMMMTPVVRYLTALLTAVLVSSYDSYKCRV